MGMIKILKFSFNYTLFIHFYLHNPNRFRHRHRWIFKFIFGLYRPNGTSGITYVSNDYAASTLGNRCGQWSWT